MNEKLSKANRKINYIKKCIMTVVILIAMMAGKPAIVYANAAIGITDEFEGMDGDGKYLGKEYRNNYRLDTEKLGITDAGYSIVNMIGNAIFELIRFLGFIAVSLFYYAMDFDLAELLEPFINSIQDSLRSSIFLPMFKLAYVGAVILMILRFVRRDFMGIAEQFFKVVFILVLSMLIVNDSATILSYTTNITKGISVDILTGVSGVDIGGSNVKSYAASAAGTLWVSLVHNPWTSLEFGSYSYSDEDVEFFLSDVDDETREQKVEEIRQENPKAFRKQDLVSRIAQGLIILIIMLFKSVIYILLAVMQIVFQLVAIFYVLLAPVILLLALLPGFDFEMLGIWVRKIFESQLGIVLLTFTIGLLVLIDQLLYQLSSQVGWIIALALQVAVGIGLYIKRNAIFGALSSAQSNMRYPRRMKMQLRNSGNAYEYVSSAANQARNAAYVTGDMANRLGNKALDAAYATGAMANSLGNMAADGIGRFLPRISETEEDTYEESSSRPSTVPRLPAPKDPEPREARGYDTGIKSCTYYAPPEVTDNLDELWRNAKRPTTEQKNVPHRTVVGSQSTQVHVSGSGPTINQAVDSTTHPTSTGTVSQSTTGRTVEPAVQPPSGAVHRPTTSQAEPTVQPPSGAFSRPTTNQTEPTAQATTSEPVPRPTTSQAIEPAALPTSGAVPRPTTSQEVEPAAQPPVSGTTSRSAISQEVEPAAQPTTSGTASRPITSQEVEPAAQPPASGTASRPVTRQEVESAAQPTASGTTSRPVTSQEVEPTAQPTTYRTASRPTTSQPVEPAVQPPASGTTSRPAASQEVEPAVQPTTSGTSRPVTSQEVEPAAQPTVSGTTSRPATSQAVDPDD